MSYRAVVYAAVSDPSQVRDHYSIDEQLVACRAECQRRQWPVAAEIVIPGHSRFYRRLHELVRDCAPYAQLIALVEARQIDLIVCYALDRLWRTDRLRMELEDLCEDHGVQIYAVSQPVEPRVDITDEPDFARRWVSRLSGALSEDEIARFKSRSQAGKLGRARAGLHMSWIHPPYGYRQVDTHQPLEVEESQALWVRWIFERRAQGWSMGRIANTLNARGIPSAHGAAWRERVVKQVLSNAFYAGRIVYRRYSRGKPRRVTIEQIFEGRHQPLVSTELWEAAQRINAAGHRDYHSCLTDEPHILTGMLRCGLCGDAMCYRRQISSNGNVNHYIYCSRYNHTNGEGCSYNGHSARQVEAYVLDQVRAAIQDPQALLLALDSVQQRDRRQERIAQLEASLQGLEQRAQRLLDAVELGHFPLDELARRQKNLSAQRQVLEHELATLRQSESHLAGMLAQLSSLHDLADELDHLAPSELRQVYRQLIHRITLRRGESPHIDWLA